MVLSMTATESTVRNKLCALQSAHKRWEARVRIQRETRKSILFASQPNIQTSQYNAVVVVRSTSYWLASTREAVYTQMKPRARMPYSAPSRPVSSPANASSHATAGIGVFL